MGNLKKREEEKGEKGRIKIIKQRYKDDPIPILEWLFVTGTIEGNNYVTQNPTRVDHNPGSFKVSLVTGKFNDFATGDHGGSIIDLVMYVKHYNLQEAIQVLSKQLRIEESDGKSEVESNIKKIWEEYSLPNVNNHKYLARKQITIGNARINDYRRKKSLVIPMTDSIPETAEDFKLVAVQYIDEDGSKRNPKGNIPHGAFSIISDYTVDKSTVVLVEGYSTGRSVTEATGLFTVASMGKGRFSEVIQRVIELLPNSKIVVAGDNDDPGKEGINNAFRTAQTLGKEIYYSIPTEEGEDFNDLMIARGKEAVKTMIDNATKLENPLKIEGNKREDTDLLNDNEPTKKKKQEEPDYYQFKCSIKDGVQCKEGNRSFTKICDYIEIKGLLTTLEEENWKTHLTYIGMDNEIKEIAIENSKFNSDCKDLFNMLTDKGFCPNFDRQKTKLYLIQEFNKKDKLERKIETQKVGKLDQNSYVYPSFTVCKGINKYILKGCDKMGYEVKGNLHQWVDKVATPCKNNSVLIFSICVALSPILINFFPEINSTFFHITGDTSKGKSTALKVACSVWGNPKTFVQQWDSTKNGLELMAVQHNDALFVLDEITQSNKDIEQSFYMLNNGQGKKRSDQNAMLKQIRSWEFMGLSSGEVGVKRRIQETGEKIHEGISVRCIDIEVSKLGAEFGIFEDLNDYKSGQELAEALINNSMKYYGIAAKAFVEQLVSCELNVREIFEKLKQELIEELNLQGKLEGMSSRILNVMSLVYLAGILSTQDYFKVTPFRTPEIKNTVQKITRICLSNIKTREEMNEEAIDILCQLVATNQNQIYTIADKKYITEKYIEKNGPMTKEDYIKIIDGDSNFDITKSKQLVIYPRYDKILGKVFGYRHLGTNVYYFAQKELEPEYEKFCKIYSFDFLKKALKETKILIDFDMTEGEKDKKENKRLTIERVRARYLVVSLPNEVSNCPTVQEPQPAPEHQ